MWQTAFRSKTVSIVIVGMMLFGGISAALQLPRIRLQDDLATWLSKNDEHGRALEQFSIGRLAARSLPGTNQPLEWRHLLAWCIREQRTRFDGFYHWREGEGLGFKRSRRDPPLLVGSVLGLVDQELDRFVWRVI